jgi:hypothetical protein
LTKNFFRLAIFVLICKHNQKFKVMKKLFVLMLAIIVSGSIVFAQESGNDDVLKNKKGEVILPQAGDYAIGVSSTPFINLVGNLVKINSATPFVSPLAWNFISADNAIYGKYFMTNNTAIRAAVRLGMGTTTLKNYVPDDKDNTGTKTVLDKWTHKATNVLLSAGLEKRRGSGRLQAFYGAGAYLGLAGSSDNYVYENDFSSTNTTPTSTVDWTTNPYTVAGTNARTLSYKEGKTISFGLRGFVGVEYFVLPKISLGGEFGYGFGLSIKGDGTQVVEQWNYTDNKVETVETQVGGGSSMGLDNDNFGGIIYLMFHF